MILNDFASKRVGRARTTRLLVVLFFISLITTPLMARGDKKNYPASFDWSNVDGCNYVTPAKSQHPRLCASCVAFGVAAALESNARIALNLPVSCKNGTAGDTQFENLSEAQLFFCNTNCYQGWTIPTALDYCKSHGAVPESYCPTYDGVLGYCKTHKIDPCGLEDRDNFIDGCCRPPEDKVTRITGYVELKTHEEMKKWISTKGPVVTSMFCDIKFLKSPGDGVYTCKTSGPQNHVVCCIGYDDEKKAWLCKNSFGPEWGEDGLFWFAYGQCGGDNIMFGIEGFSQIYTTAKTKEKSKAVTVH